MTPALAAWSVPPTAITALHAGLAARDRGDLATVIAACQEAIVVAPTLGEAYALLAETLASLGRSAAAIASWRRAIGHNPREIRWHHHLYHLLAPDFALPAVYESEAEIDEWRSRYGAAIDRLAAFLSQDSRLAWFVLSAALLQNHHFFLGYHGRDERSNQARWGQLVSRAIAIAYPGLAAPLVTPPPTAEGKLRIGYCTDRWHHHTVTKLFGNWLIQADRDRFELYGYSVSYHEDDLSDRLRQACDRFRWWQVGQAGTIEAWAEFAQAIRDDQLHILVFLDVGMFPPLHLLAGARLAPVQAVTWGHPITTGLPTVDYFLSSDRMEPADGDRHYTETLVRLPNLSVSYDRPAIEPVLADPGDRAAFHLPEGVPIYLCCQSLYKYLPRFDALLIEIARQVPEARFCFIQASHPTTTDRFIQRLDRALTASGLPTAPRLIFQPAFNQADYWRLNLLCDVFLDTCEWSGGNTTLEAIACGLPIVTWPGQFMRGRHSAAILAQIGVTETIAHSAAEYVALAVRLGRDRSWRQEISQRVRDRADRAFGDRSALAALEAWFDHVGRSGRSGSA